MRSVTIRLPFGAGASAVAWMLSIQQMTELTVTTEDGLQINLRGEQVRSVTLHNKAPGDLMPGLLLTTTYEEN